MIKSYSHPMLQSLDPDQVKRYLQKLTYYYSEKNLENFQLRDLARDHIYGPKIKEDIIDRLESSSDPQFAGLLSSYERQRSGFLYPGCPLCLLNRNYNTGFCDAVHRVSIKHVRQKDCPAIEWCMGYMMEGYKLKKLAHTIIKEECKKRGIDILIPEWGNDD